MCKRMIVIGMLLAVMVAVSGCQAVDGFFEDAAGISNAVRSKVTTPLADKAKTRDAEMTGEQLTRYHAEQAGRFAAFKPRGQ